MIDLWWHFRDQPYPPYPGGLMLGDKSTPKVLESQQEFYGILESPTLEVGITGNKAFNWAEYTADNMLVYLTGKVEYLDGTNGHHVTSFCRAWSRSDRTFKILPEMPTTYNRQG
jgi:hypothetical protein